MAFNYAPQTKQTSSVGFHTKWIWPCQSVWISKLMDGETACNGVKPDFDMIGVSVMADINSFSVWLV
jgi:hypothetical protein